MAADRVTAAYEAIRARAAARAGEPTTVHPPRDKEPLPPILDALLTAPAGAPPCAWPDGCPDTACFYVLTGSGTPSEDGDALCGRHARRRYLAHPSVVTAIPPTEDPHG